MKKPPPTPPKKKPPPTPPKGGESLLDEDLQYSPYLSSPERMGLSPFRGSWRGLEVGGGFPLLQRYTLHVTFLLMEFSWGGREGIVLLLYIIYIIYNNNFIYILIYNLFTLKIYILLLFVLLCLFCP